MAVSGQRLRHGGLACLVITAGLSILLVVLAGNAADTNELQVDDRIYAGPGRHLLEDRHARRAKRIPRGTRRRFRHRSRSRSSEESPADPEPEGADPENPVPTGPFTTRPPALWPSPPGTLRYNPFTLLTTDRNTPLRPTGPGAALYPNPRLTTRPWWIPTRAASASFHFTTPRVTNPGTTSTTSTTTRTTNGTTTSREAVPPAGRPNGIEPHVANSEDPDPSPGYNPTAVVVAMVILGLLLIIGSAICITCFCMRRGKAKADPEKVPPGIAVIAAPPSGPVAASAVANPNYDIVGAAMGGAKPKVKPDVPQTEPQIGAEKPHPPDKPQETDLPKEPEEETGTGEGRERTDNIVNTIRDRMESPPPGAGAATGGAQGATDADGYEIMRNPYVHRYQHLHPGDPSTERR